MIDKPVHSDRTFESRLRFIEDIFLNLYDKNQIMTNCINYKLYKSFKNYSEEINNRIASVKLSDDPLSVLHKIK